MLNQEEYMEIKILQRQGKSIREIARNLGISRNTVRTYLRSEKSFIYQRRTQVISKLDPYKKQIMERIKEAQPIRIPATVIYREIKKQGYQGKERIVQYFLRELYEENQPKEQLVRFETPPGKQMQVDWTILQGEKNRLLAFAGVLGYSRSAYVEFVFF
jgi:transposase